MAYSDNIRKLTLILCALGHSPEEIANLFSYFIDKGLKDGLSSFKQLAESLDLIFTEADWQVVKASIPTAKTIRKWCSVDNNETQYSEPLESVQIAATKRTNQNDEDYANVDCLASPDDIDVSILKEWGVPKNKAGSVLRKWRSSHREGTHDVCCYFLEMREDLKNRKIPFEKAEALLECELKAKKFGLDFLERDAKLARKYRPWESRENLDAYLKEINDLDKPGPRRAKHLEEISGLLRNFQYEVERAKTTQEWNIIFDIENHELFENVLGHFWKVEWEYWGLKRERIEYKYAEEELVSRIAHEAPSGVNENFASSVARYSILKALGCDLPDYRVNKLKNSLFQLSIREYDTETPLLIGKQDLLKNVQRFHIRSINKYKKSSETKKLLKLRRKMLSYINELNNEIKLALTDKSIIYSHCSKCPED